MQSLSLTTLLSRLCGAYGVSGYESLGTITTELDDVLQTSVGITTQTDKMGNLWATKGNGKKRMLMTAHLDEVGFLVAKKISSRSVQLVPLGGIDWSHVQGESIVVHTRDGQQVLGVLTRSGKVRIDASLVAVGDWGSFARSSRQRKNTMSSPALDNRTSCTALVSTLVTARVPRGWTLEVLFATQHEIGGKMSIAEAVRSSDPDVVVVCDSAYARPDGMTAWQIPELGAGPALQLAGNNFVTPGWVVRGVERLAQRVGIPLQYEIVPEPAGGTDASKLSNTHPFVVINIPVQRQHTAKSVVDLRDIEHAVQLFSAMVMRPGEWLG